MKKPELVARTASTMGEDAVYATDEQGRKRIKTVAELSDLNVRHIESMAEAQMEKIKAAQRAYIPPLPGTANESTNRYIIYSVC